MLKEGMKAPEFALKDKDGNGVVLKVMPKVKPDANAAETAEFPGLK